MGTWEVEAIFWEKRGEVQVSSGQTPGCRSKPNPAAVTATKWIDPFVASTMMMHDDLHLTYR